MTSPRALQRINENYPWQLWTDGQSRTVRMGVDFFVSRQAFRNACYRYARRNGMHCHTSLDADDGVCMRFWPADE